MTEYNLSNHAICPLLLILESIKAPISKIEYNLFEKLLLVEFMEGPKYS